MLVIHGENITASRQRLTGQLKSFSGEIIRLDGKKITLTELKQALESSSLFGSDRLVVIENLFSRPASKIRDKLLQYCKDNQPQNLIIWDRKKIDGRALTAFKQAEKFEIRPIIFKFLESLTPHNQKNNLGLLHQCLQQDPVEMIFYMICRQARLLILAHDLGEKGLPNMVPWQKTKLVRQANRFSLKQLLHLYKKLLIIDYQQKTGQAAFSLNHQLDLLLSSI